MVKQSSDWSAIAARAIVPCNCSEENLPPFDREAVARIVEYGSELCSDQTKLSTRFGEVADLIREASFWAFHHGEEEARKSLV